MVSLDFSFVFLFIQVSPIPVNQFVSELKQPTRKVIENKKFLSTKIEIILRAAAKEFNNNNDPMTLIEGEETEEKASRKRRYTAESSDCDATQVEDLPGYSPELKKRHRLNSNSFIYVEGQDSGSNCSSISETSDDFALYEMNVKRDLREDEYQACFSNSFVENLAQNITKEYQKVATPAKIDEEQPEQQKEEYQDQQLQEQSNALTGDLLDDLIRNVLDETHYEPNFEDVVYDAGKFFVHSFGIS